MFKNQRELVSLFSSDYRPEFNDDLFRRRDDDIMNAIKQVIRSICSKGTYFTIKVLDFETIYDYSRIKQIMHDYGEEYRNRNKNKSDDNMYDFIDIKPTTYNILMVTYELTAKDDVAVVSVPICVPRFVNKYYMNIQGNLYLPQLQLVDGSTYNNSLTNSKHQSITLKTLSPPIRIYKRSTQLLTVDKRLVDTTFFDLNAFTKTSRSFKYVMAEYGMYGALRFLEIEGISVYNEHNKPEPTPDMYLFHNNTNIKNPGKVDVYIQVPKFLFDNDVVTQNMVVSIMDSTNLLDQFDSLFDPNFWKRALGADFDADTVEKGIGILTSFKGILDDITKDILRLPMDMKRDMFCVLKWMISEFSALRAKDNLNILTKRVRLSEYIAAIYATRLNHAVYRIPDMGQRVSIEGLKKIVVTDPMYLIKQLPKTQLIPFRDIVTDCDATEATKFTIKGQSGLGDNNSKSIPEIYRYPHESHFGILDLDAVSAGDPGVSGIICPMTKLYEGGAFSDYMEPVTWDRHYYKLLDKYHKLTGQKEVIKIRRMLTGRVYDDDDEELSVINQVLDITSNSIATVENMLKQNSKDGRICPIINLNEDGKIDLTLIEDE